MNGRYILDARGEPYPCEDLIEWATWFETSENRRVDADQVGPYFISTIFLGLDYDFLPMRDPLTYRPLLWETMVFKDGPVETRRYRSREEALRGHKEFVDLIRLTKSGLAEGSARQDLDQQPEGQAQPAQQNLRSLDFESSQEQQHESKSQDDG